MVLFPVLIQPCMHKVIDLPLGTTHSAIMHLSARLKYPLGQIYTVDAPQKSGEQILQLYGLCGNRKIFINEKIKEKCSTKEIVALFVHELGHWRSNHFFVSFVITEIITAVVFYMMRLFLFSKFF